MRNYIPEKKNLFIFGMYPEIFYTDDTYLILGNKISFFKVNLDSIENIFSIYYIPDWLTDLFLDRDINIFYLDEKGNFDSSILRYEYLREHKNILKDDLSLRLLKYKATYIDKIFNTSEGTDFLKYSQSYVRSLSILNKHLDYLPKAYLMDVLKLKYRLTNIRAKEISETLMNLIDNIIPLSFCSKLKSFNLDPDSGFLNSDFPSLARDLTEIPRLKFKAKMIHLFETYFFEGRDLSRKNFPDTTVKFLKKLSTYFFYGNRFKRTKEVYYFLEAYKRGKLDEVFSDL
ncbi:hypothetical protein [Persephonella sp.]